jgi:tetratricopeptide (TPR) repeat protein
MLGEAQRWTLHMSSDKEQRHDKRLRTALQLHGLNKLAEAESMYRAILQEDPDNGGALYYLGLSCAQSGRHDEAIPLLRAALKLDAGNPEIHSNLGSALSAAGRIEEAVQSYERALVLDRTYAHAYKKLGSALGALGRHREALASFEEALKTRPNDAETLNNIGTECFALADYQRSIDHFAHAIAMRPDFSDAHFNMGNAYLAQARPNDALASYELAARFCSDAEPIRSLMGNLLLTLNRPQQAIDNYTQVLRRNPAALQVRLNMGSALQFLNRHAEAIATYQCVLKSNPRDAEAHDRLGTALAEAGDSTGAGDAFRNALNLEPSRVTSYLGLVNSAPVRIDDPIMAQMMGLLHRIDDLPDADQTKLHFALAKALSDVGEHKESFQHLASGNRLKRSQLDYDEAATLALIERSSATCGRELLQHHRDIGNSTRRPIFIVGMMRSGSTLIEQILASHPDVFAAGECLALEESIGEVINAPGEHSPLPDFSSLGSTEIQRIGTVYLEKIATLEQMTRTAPADRFTDKLLSNFRFVGLIHLAFPKAAIIHSYRDPIDTCLSCYARLFADRKQPQTYDLAELGRYYRAYAKLMSHWRSVLPVGTMLEVRYDNMINSFEREARRILEFCGLEWNDACFKFYQTKRPVRTASMSQVRQPIYRTSLKRPKPDAEVLRPLLSGLGIEADDGVSGPYLQ